MLQQYQNNGFKTLVSNDYDYIVEQLIEYFRDVRIKCSYCSRRFISSYSYSITVTVGVSFCLLYLSSFTYLYIYITRRDLKKLTKSQLIKLLLKQEKN